MVLLFVTDASWDLTGYYMVTLGEPHIAVRCMCIVNDRVWCAYRNQVFIMLPETLGTEVILPTCCTLSLVDARLALALT